MSAQAKNRLCCALLFLRIFSNRLGRIDVRATRRVSGRRLCRQFLLTLFFLFLFFCQIPLTLFELIIWFGQEISFACRIGQVRQMAPGSTTTWAEPSTEPGGGNGRQA